MCACESASVNDRRSETKSKRYVLSKQDGESHLIHIVMRKCICFCAHQKENRGESRGRERESDAMPVINGNSFLQFNHSRVKRNILFKIAKETTTTAMMKKKKRQKEVR